MKEDLFSDSNFEANAKLKKMHIYYPDGKHYIYDEYPISSHPSWLYTNTKQKLQPIYTYGISRMHQTMLQHRSKNVTRMKLQVNVRAINNIFDGRVRGAQRRKIGHHLNISVN